MEQTVTSPLSASRRDFLKDVLDEYAELAGVMVGLRERLINSLHVDLDGLVRFDDRLDAHLDGLFTAGEEGYSIACEALRVGRDGSLFVVAVLAVEQQRCGHMSQLAIAAEATLRGQHEFVAALRWLPPRCIEAWINTFQLRAVSANRACALLARHVHRLPLSPAMGIIEQFLSDPLSSRRELAFRALGSTAGKVEAWLIEPGLRDPDPSVRLAALWAFSRKTKNRPTIEAIAAIAAERFDLAEMAFELAARCIPENAGENLLSSLPPGEMGERAGIRAVAAAGYPSMVPWLISRLHTPSSARFAAWAYATVTGCNLLEEGLGYKGAVPPGMGPNDDPQDERTAMLPEHGAPWPDAKRVEAHWERWRIGANWNARYILGQPITRERLSDVLKQGTQPLRTSAAMELAMLEPEAPLFCTSAPGFRQRAQLGG